MGLTDEVAFTKFALAPLHFRRDVAMLGFLFKCAHRQVSDSAHTLFRADGRHLEMLKNGLFGAAEVFNKLPEEVVRLLDVHAFQRALTQTARLALKDGKPSMGLYFIGSRFAPLIFVPRCLFSPYFFFSCECLRFTRFRLWQSLYLLMVCEEKYHSENRRHSQWCREVGGFALTLLTTVALSCLLRHFLVNFFCCSTA